jgi:MFS family permease
MRIAALVLALFAASSGQVLIYSMLATLYRVFADPTHVGWVVTAYMLAAAIAAALCGRYGDLLGRRRVLLFVLVLCFAGTVLSATATSWWIIVAGCALQGAGGAGIPLCIGLAREALPPDKVAVGVGVITAAWMVGSGVAFLIGGVVVDHWSWRGVFALSALCCVVAMTGLKVFIPVSQAQVFNYKDIRLAGGLMFVPALIGILLAVDRIASWGWSDPRIVALLVGSLLVLVLWVNHQARQRVPLLDVRLFANRQFILANLCVMLSALGCMQFGQIMSLLLQQPAWTLVGFGLSATAAGFVMMPLNSSALIGSPWSGKIAVRYGARRAALVGSGLVALTWGALTAFRSSLEFVLPIGFICLVGFAMLYAAIFNLIVEATPKERTSEAAGMAQVLSSAFMAIGAQLVFFCLATSTVHDASRGAAKFPSDAAYTLTFGYVTLMSVIAVISAWLLPRRE